MSTSGKQLYDDCTHVSLFISNLSKFIKEIVKISNPDEPIMDELRKTRAEYKKIRHSEYINQTHELMAPHYKLIETGSNLLFSDEYTKDEVKLLPNFNIKKLTPTLDRLSREMTSTNYNTTLRSIFKFLELFYITSESSLTDMKLKKEELLEKRKSVMTLLKTITDESTVSKLMDDKRDEFNEDEASIEASMKKIRSMIGEDSIMNSVIVDVFDDMGFDTKKGDVFDIMMIMMDPKKRERVDFVLEKTAVKIKKKVQSGELKLEELTKDMMQSSLKLSGKEELDIDMSNPASIAKYISENFDFEGEEKASFMKLVEKINNKEDLTKEETTQMLEMIRTIPIAGAEVPEVVKGMLGSFMPPPMLPTEGAAVGGGRMIRYEG